MERDHERPSAKMFHVEQLPAGQGFLMVRVGSDQRPASTQDIEDVAEALSKLRESNEVFNCLVSHHALDVRWVPLPEKEIETS